MCQPSTVAKYRLSEQTFSQFFPDEPPLFPFSPPSKGGGRGSPGQVSDGSPLHEVHLRRINSVFGTHRVTAVLNDPIDPIHQY